MVQIGDTVQFNAMFCKNVGAVTGGVAFLKGKVTDITGLFATVQWEGANSPSRVLIANLKRVTDWEPN